MKMSKKVREYKSGDFIFAKVKGYPAWPARVQKLNGKRYFVYFYGTGETANLPPNMIFDYAENKDKFLTKMVKRRDFNDGVKQIEYDFANNVPLEQVVGLAEASEVPNNTINESANETMDDSTADTTAADETMAEENTTQNDTGIEDSDETGALVIDEGKAVIQKGRKSTAKTPAKEPLKAKEPKTPRGRPKRDEAEDLKDDEKKEDEIVSRSGRKIRPKRYIDEQTEDNATLPSPAPKKRRGVSPPIDKEKEKEKDKVDPPKDKAEKNIKHFNAVPQSELEDLKEPFTPEDAEKENIVIAYLPSGQYIGIKLFQSRPNSFKNESIRLQWDRQAASNALTLKMQLEKGQITAQSVLAQLVMDLNLTDEEKATLDKERETDEKKSRVQFLKTEMKLIELDAKIKTCLCLEKADTELCLKLLDELMELDVKPLMLLKHPTCLETVKRMRAYVGNTPSWDLSERAALQFSQHALRIRRQADALYAAMQELFKTPEGLSFWEFFMERVALFKKVTSKLSSDELLELVHEPLEMSVPTSHTMKTSVEAANEEEQQDDEPGKKAKSTPAKTKKTNNTTSKPPLKRQSSRKLEEKEREKEKEKEKEKEQSPEVTTDTNSKPDETEQVENNSETKETTKDNTEDKETESPEDTVTESKDKENKKDSKDNTDTEETETADSTENVAKETAEETKSIDKSKESSNEEEKKETSKEKDKAKEETEKEDKTEKSDKEEKEKEKIEDEPRAKRTRESKKTEPPPRSPTKRKSKF
ncbi:PC4 and SFRS1-interacting protein [Nymphalis io]|uniref:PC4 and SFRS1-interacting protein n=1 Tax=Inachis io TaxID=171585 RepID=UPI002166CA54|nr:PC4 and SFRS1-interacting protein [Nymphalis io]